MSLPDQSVSNAALAYVRGYYKVPANVGQRIRFQGRPATIVGGRDQYLLIEFDGDPDQADASLIHPAWEVEYVDA